MISVWINGQQRDGIDEGWIGRTIQSARRKGEAVCARVSVKGDGLDLAVTAGNCPSTPGGRQPNPRERLISEQWDACGLPAGDFAPGQLIQCLKRLERTI